MTANEIDIVSSKIKSSNITLNSNSSYEHAQESQSHSQPNLASNDNNKDKDDDDPTLTKSASDSAYNYAASTLSGAYSYMTSFYPSQSQPQTLPENSPNLLNHSQSHSMPTQRQQKEQQNEENVHNQIEENEKKNDAQSIKSSFDASKADFEKYPRECNENSASQSDLHSVLEQVQQNGVNVAWTKNLTEPLAENVKLRSMSYKSDGKKQIGGDAVFRLVHVQAFKTDIMMDHIAMHPSSWFNQNIAMDDMSCFTIIVHLQVKSIGTSFISYHIMDVVDGHNCNGTPIIKGDKACTKLLDFVLNCNDNQSLNDRLKLIPRVVSGPYPVKRVVENRPVLLGNKVSQKYFRGCNYFEIDSKVDESMVAGSIIKLCHRFAKRIVVEMAWTIQGENMDELPERLLCGVTIHNMDFSKCNDVNYEMENCHKLKYKTKDKQKDKNEEKTQQNI